jgi:hypothetical protein
VRARSSLRRDIENIDAVRDNALRIIFADEAERVGALVQDQSGTDTDTTLSSNDSSYSLPDDTSDVSGSGSDSYSLPRVQLSAQPPPPRREEGRVVFKAPDGTELPPDDPAVDALSESIAQLRTYGRGGTAKSRQLSPPARAIGLPGSRPGDGSVVIHESRGPVRPAPVVVAARNKYEFFSDDDEDDDADARDRDASSSSGAAFDIDRSLGQLSHTLLGLPDYGGASTSSGTDDSATWYGGDSDDHGSESGSESGSDSGSGSASNGARNLDAWRSFHEQSILRSGSGDRVMLQPGGDDTRSRSASRRAARQAVPREFRKPFESVLGRRGKQHR